GAAIRTVPAAPRTYEGLGKRMVEAEITRNKGTYAAQIRAAFAAHGMTLPAPATSLTVPLERKKRGDGTAEVKTRLGVPRGAEVEVTPVDSDMHESMAHVSAYREVPLAGIFAANVVVKVPVTARVTRRGRSITGVVGEVGPGAATVDSEARAFVQTLVNNGQVRVTAQLARRIAPIAPQLAPQRTPTHEIRTV